jgi:D-3-phosphoglycerate dehydrogenase
VSNKKVLVTCPQMQGCIDVFRAELDRHGVEVTLPKVVQQLTEAELMDLIGGFDGMIAGDDPLTSDVLARAVRLRVISKWGVGTDGIDLEAARSLGIVVTNTPGAFSDEVADVVAGYLVMLARQLHRIDASVRAGGWSKPEGQTLRDKILGIIGFGSIGQAVARRGIGLGMNVTASDIAPLAREEASGMAVTMVGQAEVFREADFLVLCTPLTAATRHIANATTMATMRPGSYIVNVARGPLIDEPALCEALATGHIGGAALDVYECEPLPPSSQLRGFPQCVLGSHNGSNTREAVLRASAAAVGNLLQWLETR